MASFVVFNVFICDFLNSSFVFFQFFHLWFTQPAFNNRHFCKTQPHFFQNKPYFFSNKPCFFEKTIVLFLKETRMSGPLFLSLGMGRTKKIRTEMGRTNKLRTGMGRTKKIRTEMGRTKIFLCRTGRDEKFF